MDTRRKITVDLKFYNQVRATARKEKLTLGNMLALALNAYLQVLPRQKQIEKRVTRLEKHLASSHD